MALTVEEFKTFLHSTLMEQFPDVEITGDDDTTTTEPNATLISAVSVANQAYNSLTGYLPARAVVRFDSLSFQIKSALCFVYEYVLQDHGILHALSLQNMSLSEGEIFDNYFQLLKAERDELAAMRKELLDEIDKKDSDIKNQGVMLFHRYPRSNRRGLM